MDLFLIRHRWPNPAGHTIDRPYGATEYIFAHFITPVKLWTPQGVVTTLPHTLIMFAPGQKHWFCAEQPLLHDWMHVIGDDVAGFLSVCGIECGVPYVISDGNAVSHIMEDLEHEFFADHPDKSLMIDCRLRELFLRWGRETRNEVPRLSPTVIKRLTDLRQEMLSDMRKKWTVEEMAKRVFLGRSQFEKRYKELFGVSPARDLILVRVEFVRQLSLKGDLTNAQMATLAGYSDEYFMLRQFRSVTGMTPQQYAEKVKNPSDNP